MENIFKAVNETADANNDVNNFNTTNIMNDFIEIYNANEHNLNNVDVKIPKLNGKTQGYPGIKVLKILIVKRLWPK